jgi:outer membrane biosynthesis protein TonB
VYAPQVQPMPPAPFAASDPFAQAPLVGGGQGAFSPTTSTSLVPPPEPKRGGVPLWFWPILVFTGVFGVAAAIFVFRPQPTPAPVVIQMPGTATPSTATVQAKTDTPPVAPTAETSASPSASVKLAAGGPKAAGTASAAPEKKGVDVSSLLGGGAGGPNIGGPGGPGPGGGGLDSSSVERVVASHRAGVKRTCWERGGADQKSSVNVTVSATVAPDGSVSGTSSSGDDPVVAKCIESQVRTWRFNAPGSTTTVNIPFKFVRQ